MSKNRIACVVATILLVGGLAQATTYMMVADEDLTDGALAIAVVSVQGRQVVEVGNRIYTDFYLRPETVLKGDLGASTVRVRRLGGVLPDGRGLYVYGVPQLAVGERALVFLVARDDGTYGFEHLGLGVFSLRTIEGTEVAYRNVAAVGDVDDPRRARRRESLLLAHRPRDLNAFSAWIQERVAGADRLGEYYLQENLLDLHPIVPFTLFNDGAGNNFHIHEFSPGVRGTRTLVMHKKGLKGLKGKGKKALKAVVKKWNKIFNVKWIFGGKAKKATGGLATIDGFHAVIFNDPNNEIAGSFSCFAGGVLAIGGFHNSFGPPHKAKGSGKTRSYWDIGETDVVFQDGVDCLFRTSSGRAGPADVLIEQISGHEVGHGMGLAHSCGDDSSGPCNTKKKDDALMRASIHDDGRGAAIKKDDKNAAKALDYKS